jgi:hypothetical protein
MLGTSTKVCGMAALHQFVLAMHTTGCIVSAEPRCIAAPLAGACLRYLFARPDLFTVVGMPSLTCLSLGVAGYLLSWWGCSMGRAEELWNLQQQSNGLQAWINCFSAG